MLRTLLWNLCRKMSRRQVSLPALVVNARQAEEGRTRLPFRLADTSPALPDLLNSTE